MKKFMITFKNLGNGETLNNLLETVDMLNALNISKKICEDFKNYGFTITVISIHEIEKKTNK